MLPSPDQIILQAFFSRIILTFYFSGLFGLVFALFSVIMIPHQRLYTLSYEFTPDSLGSESASTPSLCG
jgi:hypothetical protein